MVSDYKNFLENWTVRDAVNHLRPVGQKYRLVLNEAVAKIHNGAPGRGTRVPLIDLVGTIQDRVLFALYEAYREVR